MWCGFKYEHLFKNGYKEEFFRAISSTWCSNRDGESENQQNKTNPMRMVNYTIRIDPVEQIGQAKLYKVFDISDPLTTLIDHLPTRYSVLVLLSTLIDNPLRLTANFAISV